MSNPHTGPGPGTGAGADPRLLDALDELARSMARLERLLPALEGLDGELRAMARDLQAQAGVAAAVHGRATTIVAVQRADASSRQARPASACPGLPLDLAHGAT